MEETAMDTVLKAENVVPLPVNMVGKDIRAPLDKNDFRCDELLQALPAAVYTTDSGTNYIFRGGGRTLGLSPGARQE
jgi:hypothetical protein